MTGTRSCIISPLLWSVLAGTIVATSATAQFYERATAYRGRSVPANHMGGDFFQYYTLPGDSLAVCLADVSGQAMQAAIPVVMFSGLLESQIELGESGEKLFGALNRSLCRALEPNTYVAFTLAELETSTGLLRLYSCGSPHPMHYSADDGEVSPLRVVGLPLGLRPDAGYSPLVTQLEPGDCVVFSSDGVVETRNRKGEMYGLARTAAVAAEAGSQGLAARELVDRLIVDVEDFAGDGPQQDDRTVVVLRATG